MKFQIKGKCISNPEVRLLAESGHKWCGKCKRALLYSEFDKNSKTSDGYNGRCKSCITEWRLENSSKLKEKAKLYYESNKDEKIEKAAEYRANNQDKIKQLRVNYYENKKDEILEMNRISRLKNIDKISAQQKEYHYRNKEHRNKNCSEWRKNNKESINTRLRNRYNNDLDFKTRQICRGLVRRMYLSIGTRKQMSTKDVLGYSPIQLKEHIEKLFKPGMTWDNYDTWELDHRYPICKATTLAEGIMLSQLSNLQPLWKEENAEKRDKIITEGDGL